MAAVSCSSGGMSPFVSVSEAVSFGLSVGSCCLWFGRHVPVCLGFGRGDGSMTPNPMNSYCLGPWMSPDHINSHGQGPTPYEFRWSGATIIRTHRCCAEARPLARKPAARRPAHFTWPPRSDLLFLGVPGLGSWGGEGRGERIVHFWCSITYIYLKTIRNIKQLQNNKQRKVFDQILGPGPSPGLGNPTLQNTSATTDP